MTTDVDTSQFAEHRTREELNSLLHFGHIIPVSKGWTKKHVDSHFPGWTWNQLIDICMAAQIVVRRGGAPPKCDDRVAIFHFSSDTEFFVEWAN